MPNCPSCLCNSPGSRLTIPFKPADLPPVVKNLVLAHQIDHAIRDGRARDYKALAQQMGITDARIGQIVGLCQLAPDLQEQILNGDARTLGDLSPRQLSKIAEVVDWQVQRRQFNALLAHTRSA